MPSQRDQARQAAEVAYRMANIFSYKGKADQAIVLYRRAIDLEPSYVPAYLELEALLKPLGRIEECIGLYRRAAETAPDQEIFSSRLHELVSAPARAEEPLAERHAHEAGSDPVPRSRAHLMVYADCLGIGGAEQANHAIAMGLRAAGYRVSFVQPRASHHLIEERTANGIVHVWIEEDDIYRGAVAAPSLCSPVEGESVFGRVRPELVLFCDGCPVSSLGAKQVARDLGIPFAALVHCVAREWATLFSTHLTALGTLYRGTRQVITVSHDNLALLRDSFGLPAELGTVIHNGVSATFFESPNRRIRTAIRAELGIPGDAIVCLTVARMEPVKGYQFLAKGIRELRRRPAAARLHFIWIGSGSMEPRLRAMLDRIGAAREVHLIGRTSRVQDYLDAADMFVLPSIFEGMPVSIMEAMAKGLPVMATAVSGTTEQLGPTGLLLPDPTVDSEQTIASLTDALERWSLDEGLRRQLGADCRRRAERMFTRDRMVADYVRLVEGLLDGQPRSPVRTSTLRQARS
jgi:glycosyltransferase involved in cell wall biosynthesis